MFLITWMFDKLGYMPKIDMQVGKLDVEFKAAWPFPEGTPEKKLVAKKPTVKKPAVVAKTARTKKAK
jgi:hypothetical protein